MPHHISCPQRRLLHIKDAEARNSGHDPRWITGLTGETGTSNERPTRRPALVLVRRVKRYA